MVKKGLKKKALSRSGLNKVFSSLTDLKHVLHLYVPGVDKYSIHESFLEQGEGNVGYVTGENAESIMKRFKVLTMKKSKPFKLLVIHPKNIDLVKKCEKIVIDGSSITYDTFKKATYHKRRGEEILYEIWADHLKREKHIIKNIKNRSILCTYDISKLEPQKIKSLVEKHDKLILTTDGTTVMSAKSLSKKNFPNNGIMDEFVKKELKTVILALLLGKPMCGTDIKKKVFEKFNLLLSSGTLYPLLHELEEKKLLTCHYGIKTKTYTPVDKKKVETMLNEHIEGKNFLNTFLQKAINAEDEG